MGFEATDRCIWRDGGKGKSGGLCETIFFKKLTLCVFNFLKYPFNIQLEGQANCFLFLVSELQIDFLKYPNKKSATTKKFRLKKCYIFSWHR
jgi:hypothetical protein